MISLILPSYKRADLLNLGLWSISKQQIDCSLEIIVLNEGGDRETYGVCEHYRKYFNLRHIESNPSGESRNLVFSSNIGIKEARGDIVILSCPEMFHIGNTLNSLIAPLISNKNIISIPNYVLFDSLGEIKNKLQNNLTTEIDYRKLKNGEHERYAATLPFFMGIPKSILLEIGGYDEDFIGIGGEDDDLTRRLIASNLSYHRTNSILIHLYHPKSFDETTKNSNPKYLYNLNLLQTKTTIIRNEGREWGNYVESQ